MAVTTETTRRALLGGAGLIAAATLPAFAAVVQTSAPAPTGPTISPRLARLIALHDRAEAEVYRFDEEVEMPARQACNRVLKNTPKEDEPPHEEVATTFVNAFGKTRRLSTEDIISCNLADRVATDPKWAEMGGADWKQAHLELFEANNRRRAIIDKQLERRAAADDVIRKRFRMDEIMDRVDALWDRRSRLWEAAIQCPATNTADLIAKLDFIQRNASEDEAMGHVWTAFATDVRRVIGGARA